MSMPTAVQQGLAVSVVAALALVSPWLLESTATFAAPPPLLMANADSSAPYSRADTSLAFEINRGQSADRVKFLARGQGYSLFLTPQEAVFSLSPAGQLPRGEGNKEKRLAPTLVRMAVAGGNPDPVVQGENPLTGKSHYITGNDPANWQQDIPQYGKVRYQQVYPGIDLVYYGNGGKLEYDFIVAPGEDPDQIALDFNGVKGLRIDANGDLILQTSHGDLLQNKPIVYQDIDGQRRPVEGAYQMLASNRVGFKLGRYDAREELIIDPVLVYSTYLGGDGDDQSAGSIGVDKAGNTYVAGYTNSINFPWDLGSDSEYAGGLYDAYVCKFNPAGSRPYCVYIGGSGDDEAWSLAMAPDGSAYVGGYTDSTDFPVLAAHQSTLTPGNWGDAFLLKINAAGDALEFSTYFGGNDHETIRALATDSAGAVYATGGTFSWQGFPVTPGAYQTVDVAGADAFLAKFNAGGGLVMSTLLGGTANDQGRGVTVDKSGNILVAGHTTSSDFPLMSPRQPTYGGGGDAFISKFNAAGNALLFSTYHGGSALEWGYGIKLDAASNIFLTGNTESIDFPVVKAMQPVSGGGQDAFLSRFNASGNALAFSTYLGGNGHDDLRHLQLDPAGNVFVAGYTSSADFPGSASQAFQRGVLTKFTPAGARLETVTLGASSWSIVTGLAIDFTGAAQLSGYTAAGDFPVVSAFQATHATPPAAGEVSETADMFLSKFGSPHLTNWKGDFNGDGISDILWRNNATGAGVIWPSGNGGIPQNITRITDLNWQIVGVGDFGGDGVSDILWRHRVTGSNVIWKSGRSSTTASVTGVTNVNWRVVGIGDFNGDTRDDILWHDDVTGSSAVWYSATYATRANLTRITNLAWDIVGTGDFDNDGRADVLWRNASTGQNSIWRTGDLATPQVTATVTGDAWQIAGVGDFDNSGGDDILWRNRVTGANQIWKSANVSTKLAVTGVTNQEWQIFGVADYDGNGRADILWRNTATGANVIWRAGVSSSKQTVRSVSNTYWVPQT